MVCKHLRQLYQLCQEQQIRLGSSDLIRIVCKQCGEQEICPTNLMELETDDDATKDTDDITNQADCSAEHTDTTPKEDSEQQTC